MSESVAVTRYEKLDAYLRQPRVRQALMEVVPQMLPPERLIRVLLGACQRNPELLECTPHSLAYAMLEAASLGFTPGDVLGYTYLVPYRHGAKKEATLIVGYKGLIQLAYQSPVVAAVDAGVVCDGDEFEYELGTQPYVRHRKGPGHMATEDNVTFAYAVVQLKDAKWPVVEVLTRAQIDERRKRSRARSGPWFTDFGAMCQKTALRAALTLIPKTVGMEVALAREHAAETGVGIESTRDILPLKVEMPSEDEGGAEGEPPRQLAQDEPIRDDEIPS